MFCSSVRIGILNKNILITKQRLHSISKRTLFNSLFFSSISLFSFPISALSSCSSKFDNTTIINTPFSGFRFDHTMPKMESIHDFTVKDGSGNEVNLSKYKGKVLLIVNVASQWFVLSGERIPNHGWSYPPQPMNHRPPSKAPIPAAVRGPNYWKPR